MLWFLAFLKRLLRPFGRGRTPAYRTVPPPFRHQRVMTGRGHPTHHSKALKAARKRSRIHYQGQGRRGPNAH